MVAVFLTVAILALICAVLLKSMENLQRSRNATLSALAALREHIAQRRKTAAELAQSNLLPPGASIALQNTPAATGTTAVIELAAAEAQFERLLESLLSQTATAHKNELAEAGAKIERASARYNKCVREYNSRLLGLPAAFFARLYGFKSFEVF